MKRISFFALLALVLVPPAMAHVEASPEKVPADGVARISLAAEGEESVPAVKLTVQMPAGVTNATAHPARGWKRSVKGRLVTWSGGAIQPGEVGEVLVQRPHAGDSRTSARVPGAGHVRERGGRALDRSGVVRYSRSPG